MIDSGNWKIIGQSVTGTSHIGFNVPCQDRFFAVSWKNDSAIALAVSDGAGSAKYSDLGAKICCEILVTEAENCESPVSLFSKFGLEIIFRKAHAAINEMANSLNVLPRELACTAILVIAEKDYYSIGQIGDGAVSVETIDGWSIPIWPEPQEYANCTNFITEPDFEKHFLHDSKLVETYRLAVITDGLQRVALNYQRKAPHLEFFLPFFEALERGGDQEILNTAIGHFLKSREINNRTDDDKTLVVASRKNVEVPKSCN